MGCDIHMYVEFKGDRYYRKLNGWQCGDHFHIMNPTDPNEKPERVGLLEDRAYSLFAVLAGVRNRGCDPYPCISYPRGLPDDVTKYVEEEYDEWGCDAHSCSYLTLREIVEFDNNQWPKNNFGGYILEPLIERLYQRANELWVLYDFETRRPLTEEVLKKMENIRIVFWFDN